MPGVKVRDEVAWAEQLTEFEADALSLKFRDFLVFWLETTDKLLVEALRENSTATDDNPYVLVEVLRKALEVAEQTMGFLSVEWIAQMLLVITEHWTWGEQLFEGLTFIEKRLVEQATAMKLAELQSAASIPIEE